MSLEVNTKEYLSNKYYQEGYWGNATLLDYWNASVLSVPEKVAVVDKQKSCYTYRQLDNAANKIAAFFKELRIKPGDVISVQLPNWAEFTMVYIACLKVGAITNPICTNSRAKELSYILNKCNSKVLFIPSEFRRYDYPALLSRLTPKIHSLKKVVVVEKEKKVNSGLTLKKILSEYSPITRASVSNADDLAAVLATSGTEGFPKCVMLTHNNIIASEKAFAATLNFTYLDTMLMPAPVGHATGFYHGITLPFMFGAKSVLQDIFKPDISLQLIENEKCTCSMGSTPFVYDILCTLQKKKYDISSLKFFLCGGAPIPKYMVESSLKAGLKVLGCYGATESAPHTVVCPGDDIEKIINTDGRAVAGVELRVVDESRHPVPIGVEGEEASRGPNVFMGYLNEPELTAKALDDDGWYYSGDLCKMDSNGYIKITGRKKDVIIRGGENISSIEVENILLQHPNVRDASVVSMPDERLGERSCAYVVLNDVNKDLMLEEVKDFFEKSNVSKYKYPERVEIVKRIPRTNSGKVKKFLLRQDIKKKLRQEQARLLAQ